MKKMYKFIATLLAVVSLVSIFPASALSNNIDDILFDPDYYAAANPDVVNALGRSESALRGHYERHGKAEGRAPSALFDPKVYSGLYPDIKAAFGTDWVAVYNHFKTMGIREGRQGSATFSVEAYKARYADLRSAFGTNPNNNYLYLKHWREFGQAENRIATANGAPTSTSSSSTSTNSSSNTTIMYVKTSNLNNRLNMRKSASTSAAIVAKLSYGTKVTVHSYTGSWARVTANGVTGYVSKQYLVSSNPLASTSTNTSNNSTSGQTSMSSALYKVNTSGSYLTCGYDGYTSQSGAHEGIDFKKGFGSNVYSLTDGVVTRVTEGYTGSYGLSTICIYSASLNKTIVYLHTDPSNSLYVGKTIHKGDLIATESWRGCPSYNKTHTHVEMRTGRRTSAAVSTTNSTLENPNPTSFWQSLGYSVR